MGALSGGRPGPCDGVPCLRKKGGTFTVARAGPHGPALRTLTSAKLARVLARATVKVTPFLSHGVPLSRQPGLPPLNAPIVPPLSGQSVPPLR